jgi:hypothetical protein
MSAGPVLADRTPSDWRIPMITQPPTDRDAPLIYSLDRRGPNDPRFGSIHVVITAVIAVLAATMYLLL